MNNAPFSARDLLKQRRFAPFFWTQFLGAFNDNVYKNAMIALITFGQYVGDDYRNTVIQAAALLFILPFFLFSGIAGQVAEKHERSLLIRRLKISELCIMSCAALSFFLDSLTGLLLVLFLMGTQSAFFGPVKFSIIPQHLKPRELIAGNALVESGTFLAILLGTSLGGIITKLPYHDIVISCCVIGLAILGWWNSRHILLSPASNPTLKINPNPVTQTVAMFKIATQTRSVALSILGISWFWFLGAAYLTQTPNFTREVLMGDVGMSTALLMMFSIGIATGSLLCNKLSGHKIELGLVPLGAFGISFFSFDLWQRASDYNANLLHIGESLRPLWDIFSDGESGFIFMDFAFLGIFGGFYSVPLIAMIQDRTERHLLARTVAANNVINALLMVFSAIFAAIMLDFVKLSIPAFFAVLAVLNIFIAVYIFTLVPEFAMRFLIWAVTHTIYRVKHSALDHIPEDGPAVLVCNHVSFMDALIIGGACRRPIRFVMFKPIFKIPVLNFIFRTGKAIPIDSQHRDPECYKQAFESISKELQAGELVCLFPEGKLTSDGEIDTFKKGVEKIIQSDAVPVIPLALRGLWGSFFSRKGGRAFTMPPKRFWSRVELIADTAISPDNVTAEHLEARVKALRGTLA